jgi:hypothetical protein
MLKRTLQVSILALACGAAFAQTTTPLPTTPTPTVTDPATTPTTTPTTTTPTTTTTSTSAISSQYLKRSQARFGEFAGSQDNVTSLVTGLRSGGEITLSDGVSFTAPTKPMGYGNITRSLDLAQRQLAAQGITQPTPEQLQIALMGGSLTGPNGTTTYTGVLQMRADGMGWGKIAQNIGVHPGMGKAATSTAAGTTTTATTTGTTSATTSSRSSIVTAGGGRVHTASGLARGHGNGAVAAGGARAGFNAASSAGGGGGSSALGAKVHGSTNGQGNAFGRGK